MAGTGQQPQSASPPGWYPDPWSPATVRWWSGIDWTPYTAPRPGSQQTDGWTFELAYVGGEWRICDLVSD